MKKTLFVLFAIHCMSSFCLAQQPTESTDESDAVPLEIKTFTGKVALVFLGEFFEDDLRRIEVVDEIGQRLVFIIDKKKTVISDKGGEKLPLGKINREDKVVIEYTMDRKNHKVAQSIKLSE